MTCRPGVRLRLLRLLACTVAAVAALSLGSEPARAGTYDVISCQTPSGTPTSAEGWSPWSQLLYDDPVAACAKGGRGLTAKFSAREGGVAGGLTAGWTFRAPRGTTIESVRVDGSLVTRPAADRGGAFARAGIADLSRDATGGARGSARCDAGSQACRDKPKGLAIPIEGKRELSIFAGCVGDPFRSTCARGTGSRAAATLRSARITLRDDTTPDGSIAGAAVEDNAVRGRSSLRLSAKDAGSGVYAAQIQIGSTIVRKRASITGGSCRTLDGSSAFASPTPCPRSVDRTLTFDASNVRDGSQMLTVTVWDAANNPKIVAFRPVLVDNGKSVRADGTILMPAIGDDELGGVPSLGSTGGSSGPAPGEGAPELQPLLSAMETLASMQLPYCYGGGHGLTPAMPTAGQYCWVGDPAKKFTNSGAVGFDCSSSVSWVLQQAGYPVQTQTSTNYMRWGKPGPGKYVTIWSNPSHVFLEVEVSGTSYFWGTASTNVQHGPGWHPARSTAAFTATHPNGL